MSLLTLVTVCATAQEMDAWERPDGVYEGIVVNNFAPEARGWASIGNYHLDACTSAVLGLVHSDVRFAPGALTAMAEATQAAQCPLGIVGISPEGRYWWSSDRDRDPALRSVSTLDDCALFLPVVRVRELRLQFDEANFPGFHCVVDDFCLQAAAQRCGPQVPTGIGATHPGRRMHELHWQADHKAAMQTLKRKWAGVKFRTTTA